MQGRNIFSDIHHGLCGVLQYAEPVLDIPHDLPVVLLVLLKKLGVLLHLVIHLPRKRMDLILKCGIQVMKFLLKLQKRLEGLVVGICAFGQMLKNPENHGKAANRYDNCDGNQQ